MASGLLHFLFLVTQTHFSSFCARDLEYPLLQSISPRAQSHILVCLEWKLSGSVCANSESEHSIKMCQMHKGMLSLPWGGWSLQRKSLRLQDTPLGEGSGGQQVSPIYLSPGALVALGPEVVCLSVTTLKVRESGKSGVPVVAAAYY